MTTLRFAKIREALREWQRANRDAAHAAGYCTCWAGELGAVHDEPHADFCARAKP